MSLLESLQAACPSVRAGELLARHTSFGIGGPADYYADVTTIGELSGLHRVTAAAPLPVFFLGAGSNLLVSDRGIRGLVIHLQGEFRAIEFAGPRVKVGAGVLMPTLARKAAEKGLSGVESLIGVPGTIGGGLVMNAGTREGWLGHVVQAIDVLSDDGKRQRVAADEAGFAYRESRLHGRWIVGADLLLKTDEPASIISRLDALLQYRTRTQPLATSNCGSVFKNPPEGPAAKWIEQAGFKGTVLGGARVSERHANFIVNENNATARDVQALIGQIQKRVLEKYNVNLEPEVKLVGEW